MGGAPRPTEVHAAIDAFVQKYADALWHHDNDNLLNLFDAEGSWTDPVGTPAHVGRDKIAERITKLPAMDYVKVAEVFYTKDDKVFLAKVEIMFSGKPNSFFVLDKIVVA